MSGKVGDNPYRASGVVAAAGGGGAVTWCTTAKTSGFTAVAGNGYFCDTDGGAFTVTLPAGPTAGDMVAVSDYASTFSTNNLTLGANSSKINGGCCDADLDEKGSAVTLIYVDGTRGWKNVDDATLDIAGVSDFMTATGGTPSCGSIVDTDYKVHKFTGDGSFVVTAGGVPANNVVDYLVIGGGGAAGKFHGGGGGAGGFRESHDACTSGPYTASPLASGSSLAVTSQSYPITVGGGGAGTTNPSIAGSPGCASVFSSISSAGGGNGGGEPAATTAAGVAGGSGGGGSYPGSGGNGGAGNTPSVSPAQGKDGGQGQNPSPPTYAAGGGGGAACAGTGAVNGQSGPGGAGSTTNISGSPLSFGGGGGGGHTAQGAVQGSGGLGGGGGGATSAPVINDGTVNTGGGGGATYDYAATISGGGGSGIVYIRYKFQ